MDGHPAQAPSPKNAGGSYGPFTASAISVVVFLISWGLLLLGLDRRAWSVYDEGDVLVGALGVLRGDVPYRDFWTLYGPGQYWVVAGLFKLFGPSILVERMWDSAVRAGLAALAFGLCWEFINRWLALMAWMFSLIWLWSVGFYGYPLLPAALFGLASAYLLIKYMTGSAGEWAVAAVGACAALAGLFRHDIGGYTFIAAMAAIWIGHMFGPHQSRRRASALIRLTVGALAIAIPVAVYLALQMPLTDILHPLVIYPFTVYPKVRSLPFPSLLEPIESLLSGGWVGGSIDEFAKAVALYYPWVVSALGAIILWQTRSRNFSSDLGWRVAVVVLILLVLAFSLKVIVRPHTVHVIHALIPAFVLTAFLIARTGKPHMTVHRAMLVLFMSILAYPPLFAAYRYATPFFEVRISDNARPEVQQVPSPESARHFHIDPDQAAAVAYIQKHTGEDEKIFVANGRHDITFANDVLFYFLAQRRSATKYYEFNPGLTTTADTQAAIIKAIAEAKVPYVVIVRGFDAKIEPNQSAVSSGVRDLDVAIENDYAEVARFGKYEVRKRRDVANIS